MANRRLVQIREAALPLAVLLPAASLLAVFLVLVSLLAGCMGGRAQETASSGTSASSSSGTSVSSGAPSAASSAAPSGATFSAGGREADAPPGPETARPDAAEPNGTVLALPSLHVEGTGLADPEGNRVVLRGVSTHGLAWFPGYVNAAFFRELREEWNANVVRLAMYTAESGGYCTGGDREQLKQLLRDGVRYAEEQGLYVIVDWHILSDGDPNRYGAEAVSFFSEISAEFSACSHVLYEICNEPNGVDWHTVKAYAQQVIPAIRANAPDAVILVGTPAWSQDVDRAAADPLEEYDNILYTLHFYAATHKGSLRSRLAAALDAGLPVFVSEYGVCDASGNGAIDLAEAAAWMELLNARGVGCVAWNLSNKAETSAMFCTSCTKTSGFVWEDLSASGRWVYEMLAEHGLSDAAKAPQTAGTKEAAEPAVPKAGEYVGEDGPAENASGLPMGEPGASADFPRADRSAGALAKETATFLKDGLSISVVLQNQWEADGSAVYQYSVTVTNTSQSSCERWEIELAFGQAFTLLDGWNGDYIAQGKTLVICGKDYNGALAPGASAADIGFIVAGGGEIAVG